MKASRVRSGSLTYPRPTQTPEKAIRPAAPSGTGCSSSSTTYTRTLLTGRPSALASALTDIDQSLQSSRTSDSSSGTKPSPDDLKSKIDNHEIPAPFPLSETGTALGWTKGMIRKHHERMAALAADRRAAAALVPAEKRIKPPALVKHQRKRKLRPPAAKRK